MRKKTFGAKVIGALCSVALVAGLCPAVALAADEAIEATADEAIVEVAEDADLEDLAASDPSSNYKMTVTGPTSANVSDSFTVTLKGVASSGSVMSCGQATISYDPSLVEVTKISANSALTTFDSTYDNAHGTAIITFYANETKKEASGMTIAALKFTAKSAGAASIKITDAICGASGSLDDTSVYFPSTVKVNITAPATLTSAKATTTAVALGSKASFTAAAYDQNGNAITSGLSYQWYISVDGGSSYKKASSAGNNTATMTETATQARTAYYYKCVIKDANGKSVSTNRITYKIAESQKLASISVSTAPTTLNNPAQFKVTAYDTNGNVMTTGLTYQWYVSGDVGATYKTAASEGNDTAVMTETATPTRSTFYYKVIVKDAKNNVSLTSTRITYDLPTGTLTKAIAKAGYIEKLGDTEKFRALGFDESSVAIWTGLNYQWYVSTDGGKSYNKVTTGTYNTYYLAVTATAENAGYYYKCIINDGKGHSVSTNRITFAYRS